MDSRHLKLVAACVSLCILAMSESFPGDVRAVSVQANTSQHNNWRGLRPLHSTQKDVEQLLGTKPILVNSIYIYKGPTEIVHIRYVENNCSSIGGSWNVPVHTVADIDVAPQDEVKLKDLKLDISKFARSESWHPANIFSYRHPEGGFTIRTLLYNGYEQVLTFTYGPTNEDEKLRCPE